MLITNKTTKPNKAACAARHLRLLRKHRKAAPEVTPPGKSMQPIVRVANTGKRSRAVCLVTWATPVATAARIRLRWEGVLRYRSRRYTDNNMNRAQYKSV